MGHENVHRAAGAGAQVGVGVAHAHVVVDDRDQREDFLQVAVGEGRVMDRAAEGCGQRLTLARGGQALHRDPCRTPFAQALSEERRREVLAQGARGSACGDCAGAPCERHIGRGTKGCELHAPVAHAVRIGLQRQRTRKARGLVDAQQPWQIAGVDLLERRRGHGLALEAKREESRPREDRMQAHVAAESETRSAAHRLGREAQEEERVAQALLGP